MSSNKLDVDIITNAIFRKKMKKVVMDKCAMETTLYYITSYINTIQDRNLVSKCHICMSTNTRYIIKVCLMDYQMTSLWSGQEIIQLYILSRVVSISFVAY